MSATTIEQLEIQVQSNSNSAVSGINALSNSLSRLKNATSGGVRGLTTTANQIAKLNTALSSFNGASTEKISKLTSSLSALSGLKLTGLTSAVNSLKKIPEITNSLDSNTISNFTSRISQLVNALAPLASKLNTVSAAFAKLPTNVNKAVTTTNKLAVSNNAAAKSYTNLAAKIGLTAISLRSIVGLLAGCITQSNQYIEDYNLFQVSLGQYAAEAEEYANNVSEVLGIDPGDWMRNQGFFNTIITGFGVASDKAATMSQQLTQLGYDIASYANISVSDAMAKLQSGIAGELEPLRRIGYDLSVARLQQEAYNLGIDKSVSSMTQAEKSQLRYHAILTQVTVAQGDMARTIESPANQLRVLQAQVTQCAKAIGNIFLPVLSLILPYAIAAAKAIRALAVSIAGFFGVDLADYTNAWDGISSSVGSVADNLSDASSGVDGVADGLSDATKAAKAFKSATIGIDELNVISPDNASASTGGTGGSGGGSGGVSGIGDLGLEPETYDFLGGLTAGVDKLQKKFEKLFPIIAAIGTAFLSWKIAEGVVKFMDWVKTMQGFDILGSIGFKITGLGLFLDAWHTIKEAVLDIKKNGASFENVTKLISGVGEAVSAALFMMGQTKIGGATLAISAVTGILSNLADITKNGVNFDNMTTLVKNAGLFVSGIGIAFGDLRMGGIGLAIAGVTLIVRNFGDLMDAIRTGDWSGVDKVSLVSGLALTIGGLIVAFKKIKTVADSASGLTAVSKSLTTVSTTTGQVGTKITTLGATLKNVAVNMTWGVAIIAEVCAAALIIVGSIALLGMELNQVAIAWSPVLENGNTIITAITIGILTMSAIGAIIYAMGTTGSGLAVQMGIGTLMLAEISLAADLFIAEILVIGLLLNQVNLAWQPVNANGEQIAQDILIGTALLVGIGVVTAALGAATVATAGTIPIAIGLGTAVLVELAAAFVLFCESLVAVADELNNRLSPSLTSLVGVLPTLSANMRSFTSFMGEFAGCIVSYSTSSVISGIAATIDTVIGWFTEDPLDKLATDVEKMQGQATTLKDKLLLAVPELSVATTLLSTYYGLLAKLEELTGTEVNLSSGCFVDMNVVGQNIVTGFVTGIQSKAEEFANAATTLVNGFKTALTTKSLEAKATMVNWGKSLNAWFTESRYGGVNADKWKTYGKTITTGFSQGVNSSYTSCRSAILNWANYIKNTFNSSISSNYFYNIGVNVLQGFINGISSNRLWQAAVNTITNFARTVITSAENTMEIGSPSKVFKEIGGFVIEGFNEGIKSTMGTSYSLMNGWANTVSSYSPTLAMAADVPSYISTPKLSEVVGADVRGTYTVNNDGFADNLETFYRDYIEPTLKSIASDTKRQADKNEQTIVKVGDRTIANAVIRQQKANGYSFVR